MCKNQPEPRSCTTCPKYDGMKCTAADMLMGDRGQVLQEEHRRGFICIDTGEAELKGDGILEKAADKAWAQYNGLECRATDAWTSDNGTVLQVANTKSVDDTMYHPNSATADCIVDMLRKGEGGPFNSVFTAPSPSSECPSRREGPPQKGKIDKNSSSDATLTPGGTIVAGKGIQVIENPGPIWKDTNGYWEPVRPRSCTNCKLYNDPICMKIGTHIGNREEMWAREKRDGFQCIAALPKEERHLTKTNHVILQTLVTHRV